MSSYFPYNEDEWGKIVEQAFAADAAEPQFSKAYQRRKHRMERKMMRTRCSAKKGKSALFSLWQLPAC